MLIRIRRSVLARHNQIVNELNPDLSDFASRAARGPAAVYESASLIGRLGQAL
jgi:hypothetical protein